MPRLLVFGARNLGRTIATHFVADGWDAVAVARSDETLAALPDGVRGIQADATQPDDVERAYAEAGEVDLVVDAITTTPRPGTPLAESPPDALEPYVGALVTGIFHVLRVGARVLGEQGHGTFVQVTGGSARRGNPGRGPWAASMFATRALLQSAAAELRERNVHAALLIVDGVIESAKTRELGMVRDEDATVTEDEVARAVAYLAAQSPRAWTHELQLTPRLERWVP